jgi:endonuclease G
MRQSDRCVLRSHAANPAEAGWHAPREADAGMKPKDLDQRKLEIRRAAARRWQDSGPAIAATAARLVHGGPMAAASPERAARFVARETAKRAMRLYGRVYERIIGDTIDLDEIAPSPAARSAGRPVVRIVELLDGNRIGEGFATGFLVGSGLLLTNWHVFAKASEVPGSGAQLGFELNETGLLDSGVVFELDADTMFVADEALDIALVAVKQVPVLGTGTLADYGRARLIPALGKILAGQPVSIIQHPDGRHKHWAVCQNKLVLEPSDSDLFLTYTTDTLPGSSGSPAFNYDWELVAIHHSGVPRMIDGNVMTRNNTVWQPGMPETDIDWVANEGARVSKVHAFLEQLQLGALLSESMSAIPQMPKAPKGGNGSMNIVVNGPARPSSTSVPRTAGPSPSRR